MITADTHLHTCYSHGESTPFEMHAAAKRKDLRVIGFSEHSPRPEGYNYRHEYREKLDRHLPDYIKQVFALKKLVKSDPDNCQVLLGMEIDWLSGNEDFIEKACSAYDFDYLIGSVHFIDHWGFDDSPEDWQGLSQEECEILYQKYFHAWKKMLQSGLFQIAAHPDLIKIFSIHQFHIWLNKRESQELVYQCLLALRDSGMALEISSAGLRKPCQEIYPCPTILRMATKLHLPVSIASDAHNTYDIARAFARMENYARSFGYNTQTIFDHGRKIFLPF